MALLHKVPRIKKGLDYLQKHDPVFSRNPANRDDFTWEYVGPGFTGLARIVIGQQVSTAAARSIWKKLESGMDVTPKKIIKAHENDLRGFGLSRSKVIYLKGLAEAVHKGHFDPESMEKFSNAEVYNAVTAMKGFGPWSAQMFLMFGLARSDIWSPGDLGMQYGLQHYLKLKEKPDLQKSERQEKRFSPHQTAASLLLWHMHGTIKTGTE